MGLRLGMCLVAKPGESCDRPGLAKNDVRDYLCKEEERRVSTWLRTSINWPLKYAHGTYSKIRYGRIRE
jgi:hypothetical protein